ncbi:MAG: winged helix-turn-helix domain-containing protein [Clostridiales bacterium]|nr:winged helix-turn-helix domain-containing protein [Clostridiales bacterium]
MEGFIDLRRLDKAELFKLRIKVVQLKEKGLSGKEIERLARVRANRVSEIWRAYTDGGIAGLRPKAAGRRLGGNALLPAQEERKIRQTIIGNTPDRLKMPYSLWTRQIACDYIRREYGIRLSFRSMTNYFKKWGFTCGAPAKSAGFRNSAGFLRFMDDSFPAIVRRAANENVGIYWFSETWVLKDPPQDGSMRDGNGQGGSGQESCVEEGNGPESGKSAQRIRMVAAVTARGTARFTFAEGRLSQEKCIALMSRLIRYADRKVFFIAADIKAFRGKKTMDWLKGHENSIEVFYYPANSGV